MLFWTGEALSTISLGIRLVLGFITVLGIWPSAAITGHYAPKIPRNLRLFLLMTLLGIVEYDNDLRVSLIAVN